MSRVEFVGGPWDGKTDELADDFDWVMRRDWCKQPTPSGYMHGIYKRTADPAVMRWHELRIVPA